MSNQTQKFDMWLVWFCMNGESHHLALLHNDTNKKSSVEEAWNNIVDALKVSRPELTLTVERLEKVTDPGQVDAARLELRTKYPRQLFADEYCPENPNALLFKPVPSIDELGMVTTGGRAEEDLIRFLCNGGV